MTLEIDQTADTINARRLSIVPEATVLHADWGHAAILKRNVQEHKAIFISDLHLPRGDSHPWRGLDFFERHRAETIYRVGDIREAMEKSHVAPQEKHNRLSDCLHAREEEGTKICDLPGNHDEYLAAPDILGRSFFGKQHEEHCIVDTSWGDLCVFHGHQLDGKFAAENDRKMYQLAKTIGLGTTVVLDGYSYCRTIYNGNRTTFERNASFRDAFADFVRSKGCDGGIMGHHHEPYSITTVPGHYDLAYANTGAGVHKMFTVQVLGYDNVLRLVDWRRVQNEEGWDLPNPGAPNPYARFRDLTLAENEWHKSLQEYFNLQARLTGKEEKLERKIELGRNPERLIKKIGFLRDELAQATESRTEQMAKAASYSSAVLPFQGAELRQLVV